MVQTICDQLDFGKLALGDKRGTFTQSKSRRGSCLVSIVGCCRMLLCRRRVQYGRSVRKYITSTSDIMENPRNSPKRPPTFAAYEATHTQSQEQFLMFSGIPDLPGEGKRHRSATKVTLILPLEAATPAVVLDARKEGFLGCLRKCGYEQTVFCVL
uniref:Uncharacterized protein n=1 Tax=Anopheles atroparvus TaxID=41427 RepID=A0AAG5CV04_ANOAO